MIRNTYGDIVTDELFRQNDYYCNETDSEGYLEALEQAFKNRIDY
jgi:hypothetical protein